MRALRAAVLLALLLSPLMACGGGGASTPESAARNWMRAMVELDAQKARRYVCAEMLAEGEGIPDPSDLPEDFEMDVSNIAFETISQEGDTAEVRASGTIRIKTGGEELLEQLDVVWTIVREGGQWKWCGD